MNARQRDELPFERRGVTNDMNVIEQVLSVAESVGFVLVGPWETVFRIAPGNRVERAPRFEDEAVHQLLDTKWLKVGGTHVYFYEDRQGPAHSVLVPRATKEKARLWRNLRPLNTKRKGKNAVTDGEQSRQNTLFTV